MFKNNEKRFEYDISPLAPEDTDLFSYKYQNHRPDYPISATTPLNRRSHAHQHSFDTKERHQISVQEPAHPY